MPTLYITEFSASGKNERGGLSPIAMAPPVAEQIVAIGASSAQSSLLNAVTSFVRLTTDVNCSVKFSANPTATATTMRLAAGAVEYIAVPQDGTLKIAVIANN